VKNTAGWETVARVQDDDARHAENTGHRLTQAIPHLQPRTRSRSSSRIQRRDTKRSLTSCIRVAARRLGTSTAQLYRLLDQTNYRKSVDQVLALLQVLDCDVDLVVRSKTVTRRSRGNR